jgi:hypothetical protein
VTAQEGLGPLDPQESPLWTLQHLGFVPDVAAALPTAERTVTPGRAAIKIQIDGGGAIRERPTDGKRRFRVLTLIGCCHLSGLFAQLSLLACMGVRGPDPNQTDVLEAREQILVLPIPSYRLLRHTLLRPIAVLRRPLVVVGLP